MQKQIQKVEEHTFDINTIASALKNRTDEIADQQTKLFGELMELIKNNNNGDVKKSVRESQKLKDLMLKNISR